MYNYFMMDVVSLFASKMETADIEESFNRGMTLTMTAATIGAGCGMAITEIAQRILSKSH